MWAAVGFSAGARVSLSVAEPRAFEPFVLPGNLRFRAAGTAFFRHVGRPWRVRRYPRTAADCSRKIVGWGNDGPPVELVVYPGAYHDPFYYPHLQPGRTMFGHWLEYNSEAADNATSRLRQFLDRHLN